MYVYRCLITFLFVLPMLGHAYDINCVNQAAEKYRLHPSVLTAIIEIESGGNRYAINIEGKPFVKNSYEYAYQLLELNHGKSIDVGLMQVNSQWFKKLNIPQYYGLDECTNIHLGAWILANEVNRHGYNAKAIAKYHSPNAKRGRSYALKVLARMGIISEKI